MCLQQLSLQRLFAAAFEGAQLERKWLDLQVLLFVFVFVFDCYLAKEIADSVETWPELAFIIIEGE